MDLKENQIVIFKNKKRTNDKQPEYRGLIEVGGENREVSLWVRENKTNGEKYFSGFHQEPYKKEEKTQVRDSFRAGEADDLPF